MQYIPSAALCLAAFGLSACGNAEDPAPAADQLSIANPEVVEALPGRDVTKAHMVITGGAEDTVLVGARSPRLSAVEIHETTRSGNGVAGMRRIEELPIPAGESVVLEQGGLHIMLFGVDEGELDGGLPLTLEFRPGGEREVLLETVPR